MIYDRITQGRYMIVEILYIRMIFWATIYPIAKAMARAANHIIFWKKHGIRKLNWLMLHSQWQAIILNDEMLNHISNDNKIVEYDRTPIMYCGHKKLHANCKGCRTWFEYMNNK